MLDFGDAHLRTSQVRLESRGWKPCSGPSGRTHPGSDGRVDSGYVRQPATKQTQYNQNSGRNPQHLNLLFGATERSDIRHHIFIYIYNLNLVSKHTDLEASRTDVVAVRTSTPEPLGQRSRFGRRHVEAHC